MVVASVPPMTPPDAASSGSGPASPPVEVRRSRRRTRTVSAYRRDGTVVVLIPDRFSRAEEEQWVATMLGRLERSARRGARTDEDLARRCRRLVTEHLEDRVEATSVRWVDNMTTRWASCTTTTGEIRVSERVRSMPAWVLDYVLLHELAHLIEANHGARFWRWVDRYDRAERAKGFLEGAAHAAAWDLDPEADLAGPEDDTLGLEIDPGRVDPAQLS
ncbi:MAG: family metallopeptidase [Marmoricola sp.]|nr:family metallopeptidase [Marmoricola sp.]